jgi:hypothetical protein
VVDLRRPPHLVVLLGASAGIYAASLAGVTFLQSSADRALIEDRAPLDAATGSISSDHDSLESDLTRAARAYEDALARYDLLGSRLDGMETSLDTLAGSVSDVSGAAQALPGRVSLPRVTRASSGSGGGSTSGSKAAPRAAAPATNASTGASGG